MAKHMLVILTNPVEGREDEYNDWYATTHIPDVIGLDGFLSAQRFRLDPESRQDSAPAYLVLYEIAEGRVADAQAALEASAAERAEAEQAGRTPVVRATSPAVASGSVIWWVTSAEDRIEAEPDRNWPETAVGAEHPSASSDAAT